MPRPDTPPLTRAVVLRGIGFALAIGLGAVAVWLLVTSTTQRHTQLGVLAGLWAALVGAFAMFGSRRSLHLGDAPEIPAHPGGELALRASSELERAQEAAARRAWEAQLEEMLRREIQATMTHEIGALRSEIAELRRDLVDQVGGQLRLERIETTRLIGSDLEALQHEVRQLKVATQDTDEVSGPWPRGRSADPTRPVVETARVRPVSRQTAEVEATVQPAREHPAEAAPAAAHVVAPAPIVAPAPVVAPAVAPAVAPEPAVASAPTPAPVPRPTPAAAPVPLTPPPAAPPVAPPPAPAPEAVTEPAPFDGFAGLPRLRPFTDFTLDPVDERPAYTGRRRADGEEVEAPPAANGRHAHPVEGAGPRRHRRASDDDQPNELLARLLAREGH